MNIKLTKKFISQFEKFKLVNNQYGKTVYNLEKDKIIGKLHWTEPIDVLWLYATNNEEGYEGSQTQIGIKKDGTIVWGYFSHCSCYGYEDYKGEHSIFEDKEETFKMYAMRNVDKDILAIIKERIRLLMRS